MRLVGSVKPVFIVIAIVMAIVVLFGALTFDRMSSAFKTHDDVARVTLRNFSPGAQVDYRIISDAGIIEEHHINADKQGALSLPISRDVLTKASKSGIIKYELDIAKPKALQKEKQEIAQQINPAEMLNLLLSLNPKEGRVDLAVKGLEEFANIAMKQSGLDGQQLNADWAGMFATTLGGMGAPTNDYDQLQLVFQNAGIQSDLLHDQMGMPVVEVMALTGALLGTGTRDKQTAHWSGPIAMMTEQFSAVMTQQTEIIGMMIDASIQLETQRKIQELQARAHKDYHPSEQMCRVGTFIRSVAHSESKAELEKEALNKYLINQYTGIINTAASGGPDVYENMKIQDFIEKYCHAVDNGSAVSAICAAVVDGVTTAEQLQRMDKDVDYTRAVDTKLTLDINLGDGILQDEEADILAMARYLYFPSAFNVPKKLALTTDVRPHYASRSYTAKMGVAHSSFINIIGMKAAAPIGRPTGARSVALFGTGVAVEDRGPPSPTPPLGPDDDVRSKTAGVGIALDGECAHVPGGASGGEGVCLQTEARTTGPASSSYTEDSGWAYMKSMLQQDFGLSAADIDEYLGERPSYYAQMEVLTKKIYQDPNFYVNLYDKPTNVKRIGAAMDAILLMNQRDRFESLLRREMLSATLIENTLTSKVNEINSSMFEEMQRSQIEE